MDITIKKQLLEYLEQFITEDRKAKMKDVLAYRTDRLALVLENIFQPHNASATLRTAEILGVQNVHIIENTNKFELSKDIALGSSKWINLHRFNKEGGSNTKDCFENLKKQGYKIVVTNLSENSITLDDIDLSHKHAIVFGTELTGASEEALALADYHLKLPMYGFTQSFNISVTVAVIFHDLIKRLHKDYKDWNLTDEQVMDLLIQWYKNHVRNGSKVESNFFKKLGIDPNDFINPSSSESLE